MASKTYSRRAGFDVFVDKKGVGLGVDVLHRNNEPPLLEFHLRETECESTKVCQRDNTLRRAYWHTLIV